MVNRKKDETATEVIRVTPSVKSYLDSKGKKGDSYNDIIKQELKLK